MPVQPLHTLRTHTVWGAWVAMPDFFDLLASVVVRGARTQALITCVHASSIVALAAAEARQRGYSLIFPLGMTWQAWPVFTPSPCR